MHPATPPAGSTARAERESARTREREREEGGSERERMGGESKDTFTFLLNRLAFSILGFRCQGLGLEV